jgi:hypothetical protein
MKGHGEYQCLQDLTVESITKAFSEPQSSKVGQAHNHDVIPAYWEAG